MIFEAFTKTRKDIQKRDKIGRYWLLHYKKNNTLVHIVGKSSS